MQAMTRSVPPRALVPGQRFVLDVDYTPTAAGTINVSLQDTASEWRTEAFARIPVGAGEGTASLILEASADAPIGSAYTFGAYLTPPDGVWASRVADVRIDGLSVAER